MKKIACFFICGLLALSLRSVAQSNYESAIGVRAGIPIAASLKHFVSEHEAIELNAGFWHDHGFTYFTVGAMYQYHFPIKAVEGLQWYIGGGALAQFYSYNSSWGANKPSSTAFGINAVGGLDYKFANIPLNLSADWTPTIFIARAYYNTFQPGYGGISARYTFR